MKRKICIQKKAVVAVLFGCLLLTSGCGTKINYGVAEIISTPAGAEVVNLKDSSQLGVTPVRVSFSGEADTSEFVTIQLRKVGYVSRITTFWINRRYETVEAAKEDAIDIEIELEKISE